MDAFIQFLFIFAVVLITGFFAYGRNPLRPEPEKEPKLERGKALFIFGSPGSGKTILAKNIAQQQGTFVFVSNYLNLLNRFGLYLLLQDNPDTLIIDDIDLTNENYVGIKNFIKSDKTVVEERGKKASVVTGSPR